MTTRIVDARRLERPASSARPRLRPPLSKSDAQRREILAHLLGLPPLDSSRAPDDVRRLVDGLPRLGTASTIDCGDGGAPFRFLLAQAAVTPGTTRFAGSARLSERPHAPLVEALERALGVDGFEVRKPTGAPWPLQVTGVLGAPTCRFEIDAAQSSQFASALLFAAAALALRDGEPRGVGLRGPVASEGYLAMTLDWLANGGFRIERAGAAIRLHPGIRPDALPPVPTDWTSIGTLLLFAWRTGCAVEGVDGTIRHPDRAIVEVLATVGISVEANGERVAVVRGEPHAGLDIDVSGFPDSALTLTALACALPTVSRLRGVGILRSKESDRVEAIRELVQAAGGHATLDGDRIEVTPPRRPKTEFTFIAKNDHRRAMAAATLATLIGARAEIEGADCVSKSFPGFFDECARAGIAVELVDRDPSAAS